MGHTDQSGTGLWQHLTLALCCRVSCVVPIRNNNINNAHLCDSAVLLLREEKKFVQNRCSYASDFSLHRVCSLEM